MPTSLLATLGLSALWGSTVLAQAQVLPGPVVPPAGAQGLFIPFALLTVGLGIIGTLLKVSWSMGAATTKVNADVGSLVTAINALKDELKSEGEAREADRAEHRAANAELKKSIDKLSDRLHDLELRMERAEGAASERGKKTGTG